MQHSKVHFPALTQVDNNRKNLKHRMTKHICEAALPQTLSEKNPLEIEEKIGGTT